MEDMSPEGPSRAARGGLVLGIALATCPAPIVAASWDHVVFAYDFAAVPEGPLDPAVWIINHPGSWWWVQGRTQFPNHGPWYPASEFPRVLGGACVIEHHHYNPHDGDDPNTTFLGGEIRAVAPFSPDRCYRFEAAVRCYAYPRGLVTSFFLYGFDGSKSDEIDFEFVSNRTSDDATYPGGDPVLTNTWNESIQKPLYVVPAGLDLTQVNTFRIYWYPTLRRIDWTWQDPAGVEKTLRKETTPGAVPDEPMNLYFNFWAPAPSWPDAYSAALQPVNSPAQNQVFRYDVLRVEVRELTLCKADFDRDGDVDADDLLAYLACHSRPLQSLPAGCETRDLDGDGDADQGDFGILQRCYSGRGEPADAGCA